MNIDDDDDDDEANNILFLIRARENACVWFDFGDSPLIHYIIWYCNVFKSSKTSVSQKFQPIRHFVL